MPKTVSTPQSARVSAITWETVQFERFGLPARRSRRRRPARGPSESPPCRSLPTPFAGLQVEIVAMPGAAQRARRRACPRPAGRPGAGSGRPARRSPPRCAPAPPAARRRPRVDRADGEIVDRADPSPRPPRRPPRRDWPWRWSAPRHPTKPAYQWLPSQNGLFFDCAAAAQRIVFAGDAGAEFDASSSAIAAAHLSRARPARSWISGVVVIGVRHGSAVLGIAQRARRTFADGLDDRVLVGAVRDRSRARSPIARHGTGRGCRSRHGSTRRDCREPSCPCPDVFIQLVGHAVRPPCRR